MEASERPGPVQILVNVFGAREDAIRLLLALLTGYPLGFIHRYYLYGKSPVLQHVYFTVCGLYLMYFNYGIHAAHSFINIVAMYILLKTMGATRIAALAAHIFNMVYLCVGYYTTLTDDYTVSWTTTHCILTLRLTGLVVDAYYGHKKEEISEDQKETAVSQIPSLLEMTSYSYYFGGVLVGPQFSLRRFQKFINGEFRDTLNHQPPACIKPALVRFGAGLFYIAAFQAANMFLPDEFLYSEEFEELSVMQRYLTVTVWAKLALYKYLGVWLLAEGVCILTSLAYNGKDENGNILWDGCRNIHIMKFEMALCGPDIINSFHISVRRWIHKYIYKVVRSGLTADVARVITLMYLALWHGLSSGYYMAFAIQFFGVKFEKEATDWIARIPVVQKLRRYSWCDSLRWILKKIYLQVSLGYFEIAFYVMTYQKWVKVFSSLYWFFHVVFLTWPLVNLLLTVTFGPCHRPNKEQMREKKTE